MIDRYCISLNGVTLIRHVAGGVRARSIPRMPALDTIVVFAGATIALIALPGPSNLFILARGVASGRRAAIASALGIETGTLLYVIATALGLAAVLASSAVAFNALRYLGAAYLLFLGVRALRSGAGSTAAADDGARAWWPSYRRGLLVGLANPKVALFFLAFFPQFVSPAAGSATKQVLVLGVVFLTLSIAADLLNALASSALGAWLARRPALVRRQEQAEGVAYLGIGAWALVAGGRPNR